MSALATLIGLLQVKPTGEGRFKGQPGPGSLRIYGGLILSQALDATRQYCNEQFAVQSLHGQFLRAGDHQHTIDIQVEALKDGRRFKTYNVYCRQQDKTIFFATITFHLPEQSFQHSLPAPQMQLPPPDSALFYSHRQQAYNHEELLKQAGPESQNAALEVRIKEKTDFRREQSARQMSWFKTVEARALSPWQQTLLLAYASDWNMPSVAMRPHTIGDDQRPNIASLDHAIWFYRQADMHEWLGYVQETPAALNSRGHSRGLFYNQQGELLASVNQESFLSTRDSSG